VKTKRKPERLTIAEVERAIGLKTSEWHGNCYSIACSILRAGLVEGRPAYGHYLGPVASTGYWASRRGSKFQRHGWIVLNDGRILDPTRWSFEDKKPYLAIVEENGVEVCRTCDHIREEHASGGFFNECEVDGCGCSDFEKARDMFEEYDEGGNKLREAMEAPPPKFSPDAKLSKVKFTPESFKFLTTLLGFPPAITRDMAF
jgi:hypothetical protein